MTTAKREKPKHLGRGLESLLGPINTVSPVQNQEIPLEQDDANFPIDNVLRNSIKDIDTSIIFPNPYQPRTLWNQTELESLADSIRENGVIQPILVRPNGKEYQIIAGERRFRASKLAGLTKIPAMVRNATDEQLLELALIENIHRSDLNAIERAKAYRQYMQSFPQTQEEAAQRLGESRSVIANHIRLLELPESIQQMLIEDKLSMGHARAILSLPSDEMRKKLANRAMAGRLNVREVERLVRLYLTGAGESKSRAKIKAPHIVDLESKLSSELGTRVSIDTKRNGQRGKISIEFYSLDDFDRITEMIGYSAIDS